MVKSADDRTFFRDGGARNGTQAVPYGVYETLVDKSEFDALVDKFALTKASLV